MADLPNAPQSSNLNMVAVLVAIIGGFLLLMGFLFRFPW